MKWILLVTLALLGARSANALYDPPPAADLLSAEGAWTGTLTYRDYSQPDRRVTLPTTLQAAMMGPDQLALHYVFDDGPGKVVQSYENLQLNSATQTLTWSDWKNNSPLVCRIIAWDHPGAGGCRIVALGDETTAGKRTFFRYVITLEPTRTVIEKEDGASPTALQFRDRYEFHRPSR